MFGLWFSIEWFSIADKIEARNIEGFKFCEKGVDNETGFEI